MSDSPTIRLLDGDESPAKDFVTALEGVALGLSLPELDLPGNEDVTGPHLLAVMGSCGAGDVANVMALDEALTRTIPGTCFDPSREAGAELMEQVTAARHARLARKLAEEGTVHLATAFGIRCFMLNIAPAVALGAWLLLGRLPAKENGIRGVRLEQVEEVLDANPDLIPRVRRIISTVAEGGPQLRCA